MPVCDWLIGSAKHDLAPSRQSVAVDGRNCNEHLTVLFTIFLGFTPRAL